MNTRSPSLEAFKQQYDNAIEFLTAGIKADEEKRINDAIECYREGLAIIEDAMKYKFTPQEYQTAAPMRNKLMDHRHNFTRRIQELMELERRPQRMLEPRQPVITQSQPPPQQEESGMLNSIVSFFMGAPSSYSKPIQANPGVSIQNSICISDGSDQQVSNVRAQQHSLSFSNPKNSRPPEVTTQRTVPLKSASAAKPVPPKDWTKSPELKGVDKKVLDHILNEVVEQKPSVKWDDIAGLQQAKQTLYETVILPSLRPDLFHGLRAPSKGILLFGPPGNGKTMLARAVASQSKATFFSISASSIVSKYHGESEKLVQALFAAARYLQPSVVFIDEIDSILSARSSDEHEASRRMKTEFLVQMDGVVSNSENQVYRVLLMGATNRPFELDDAILRRFPKRVHIPLPDAQARKTLIGNLIKGQHVRLSAREMDRISELTEGFSGDDLNNLCQETALMPIREMPTDRILSIRADDLRPVNFRDFQSAIQRIRPSASRELIDKLEEWNSLYGTFSK